MPDIVTTRTFSDGEKGITATKLNDIIGGAAIQTSFVSSKPVASSTAAGDNLLLLKSGGTYAQIDSSAFASAMVPLLPDPNPNIWSVRLRSFNAVGNPTFEVAQRNCGSLLTNPGFVSVEDRWWAAKSGATNVDYQRLSTSTAAGSAIVLPGTNFALTTSLIRLTNKAVTSSLAASDQAGLLQQIEGIRFRELSSDVHSMSLLVRSSVANLKFGIGVRDLSGSRSLCKLCQLGAANTFTLISLPNLPLFPPAGSFSMAAGAIGYSINITAAAGSTLTSPANDTWQNSSFTAAIGQDNFCAQPVGSTFDIAFVQHEPGALCSTLMDLPFTQNYDNCLRYFCKSYDYEVAPGSVSTLGMLSLMQQSTTAVNGPLRFPKALARLPTFTAYNHVTGAANSLRIAGNSYAVSSTDGLGKGGLDGLNTATLPAVVLGSTAYCHYTADTGW